MAPAAVAIPQFAANNANLTETHLRDSSEWNNMESALDFDLLAEYLLEDVGAGGFDFSNPDAVSPTIDLKTQPTAVLPPQDLGVVTPSGGSSFVDDAVGHAQPPQAATAPLLANGDLAGELSQVQQMIAVQEEQAKANVAPAALSQSKPPQMLPLSQSVAPKNTLMGVRHQPKPKPSSTHVAAAPIVQRPPAQVNLALQPASKRPRVGSQSATATCPSYSFASKTTGAAGASLVPPAATVQQSMMSSKISGQQTAAAVGRQKSQAQIDRRRERNRILARRTRLRKKFFFESLQKDVADLQRENAVLKSIVRNRLRPEDARSILDRCNANERLPSAIHAEIASNGLGDSMGANCAGGVPGPKKLDKEDFSLIQSIQNSQQCFIITDPSLHDNPIVYASDDFLTLTRYSQEEVLGRNCRFLQGTETSRNKVAQIRKAVQEGDDASVTFVNYTSDGTPFWNSLFIAALRDADNNIVNFIGVIVKVAGPEPGDDEYGKALK